MKLIASARDRGSSRNAEAMSPAQNFWSCAAAICPWFFHSTTVERLSPSATSRPQCTGVSTSSAPRYTSVGMPLTTGSTTPASSGFGYETQETNDCSLTADGKDASCG